MSEQPTASCWLYCCGTTTPPPPLTRTRCVVSGAVVTYVGWLLSNKLLCDTISHVSCFQLLATFTVQMTHAQAKSHNRLIQLITGAAVLMEREETSVAEPLYVILKRCPEFLENNCRSETASSHTLSGKPTIFRFRIWSHHCKRATLTDFLFSLPEITMYLLQKNQDGRMKSWHTIYSKDAPPPPQPSAQHPLRSSEVLTSVSSSTESTFLTSEQHTSQESEDHRGDLHFPRLQPP